MRQEFVETDDKAKAEKECPWAGYVKEVEGGFMCFESTDDFKIWNSQK